MNNILLPLLNQTYQDYINLILENRPNVKDKEGNRQKKDRLHFAYYEDYINN